MPLNQVPENIIANINANAVLCADINARRYTPYKFVDFYKEATPEDARSEFGVMFTEVIPEYGFTAYFINSVLFLLNDNLLGEHYVYNGPKSIDAIKYEIAHIPIDNTTHLEFVSIPTLGYMNKRSMLRLPKTQFYRVRLESIMGGDGIMRTFIHLAGAGPTDTPYITTLTIHELDQLVNTKLSKTRLNTYLVDASDDTEVGA